MKLIIDIDDEMVCNDIKNKMLEPTSATDEVIINALYSGTPVSTEGDLISRSALIVLIEKRRAERHGYICLRDIRDIIDNAPTVPQTIITEFKGCDNCELDRPQGEWIDEGQYAEGHSEHAYFCKKCGYQIIEMPSTIFENRFCKNCGANMRGKEE